MAQNPEHAVGNDAPWEPWKSPTPDFSTVPTALGPATDAGFPHFPSHDGGGYRLPLKTKPPKARVPSDSCVERLILRMPKNGDPASSAWPSQPALASRIRCDNRAELTSRHFLGWCEERKIQLIHIQPGRPMQNGHVKSFNGRLRDECLNASWFPNLADAREKISLLAAGVQRRATIQQSGLIARPTSSPRC